VQASQDTETVVKDVVTIQMSPREAAQVYTIMGALGDDSYYREPREAVELTTGKYAHEHGFKETARLVAQSIKDAGVDTMRNVIYKPEERL
jgi:hypothetical protein